METLFDAHCWAEIDLDALADNFRLRDNDFLSLQHASSVPVDDVQNSTCLSYQKSPESTRKNPDLRLFTL